jgi:hypothetical protein
VFLAQGAAGTTAVPVAIAPGGCYLAVAATSGSPRGFSLRALVGAREASDERGSAEIGAAVGFCAEDASLARIEIEARGATVSWALAVFRVQEGIWEVAR